MLGLADVLSFVVKWKMEEVEEGGRGRELKRISVMGDNKMNH